MHLLRINKDENWGGAMIPKVFLNVGGRIFRYLINPLEVHERRRIGTKDAVELQQIKCAAEHMQLSNAPIRNA